MEVQSFVQRVTMQAVIDVLEEQGRNAGLFPAAISAIIGQITKIKVTLSLRIGSECHDK
ncbi:hypothetical protein KIN20_005495 [Parelaphostrongylus tenuis]|uniref:Uncharacterized protein n=1 Tax=Parelaphostrongylus tenuis TaxID=148309 RepID=A0AAD5QHJ8_PARTN|nr:hypothetical protein KIN20_005495 [Parelaphostrongylus tenuis]